MLKQLKGYLLDSDTNTATSPVNVLKEFLFDIEPENNSGFGGLPSSAVVDNGHPLGLGNPKILRRIFQYLPTSDLIQLRRVSLRWNHFACEQLRQQLSYCQLRPSKLKSYLKLMKKCFCNPFGSFAIRIDRLDDLSTKNFFRRFSPHIIRLRVKIVSEEIPKFTILLHKLPILEELHLLRIPEQAQSVRREYLSSTAWKYGVFQFRNLRGIIFENEEPSFPLIRNYDNCLLDLINSSANLVQVKFVNWDSPIATLFQRCGLSNPKSFDGWKYSLLTNPTLTEDLIELIYQKEMKFKAMKLIISDTLTYDLMMDLTLKTADTLYHLSLRNGSKTQIFAVSIKLSRLVTLGLQGWEGPVNFKWMQDNFPNLKTLKLNRANFNCLDLNGFKNSVPPEVSLVTLESLSILPLDASEFAPVDEGIMNNVLKMFPTVKELYVQVGDNETLHVVYEGFPQLILLGVELRGEGVTNEAFTGIPENSVTLREPFHCGCPRFSFPDENRRKTHIGCLRNLRVLIIRAGKNISNLSLLEGISKLERLETLLLLSSYEPELTEDFIPEEEDEEHEQSTQINGLEGRERNSKSEQWCLRAIADSFKNLKWLVTSSDIEYSGEDMNYLRERLPHLEHETRL